LGRCLNPSKTRSSDASIIYPSRVEYRVAAGRAAGLPKNPISAPEVGWPPAAPEGQNTSPFGLLCARALGGSGIPAGRARPRAETGKQVPPTARATSWRQSGKLHRRHQPWRCAQIEDASPPHNPKCRQPPQPLRCQQ
jgi:hypothetical protein